MTIETIHNLNYNQNSSHHNHKANSSSTSFPNDNHHSSNPPSSSSSDNKNLVKTNCNNKNTKSSSNNIHCCPTILEDKEAVDAEADFNQKFFVPEEPLYLVLPSDEEKERIGSSRRRSLFPPEVIAFPSCYRLHHHREPSSRAPPSSSKRKSQNISSNISSIMGRVATYASSSNNRKVSPDDGGISSTMVKTPNFESRRPSRHPSASLVKDKRSSRLEKELDPADMAGGGGREEEARRQKEERRSTPPQQDKKKKLADAVAPSSLPQTQILVPYCDPQQQRQKEKSSHFSRPREDPPDVHDLRHGRWRSRRGTGLDPDGDDENRDDRNENIKSVTSKNANNSRQRQHGPATGNGGTRRKNQHQDDSSSVGSSQESSDDKDERRSRRKTSPSPPPRSPTSIVYPQLDNGNFDFTDTEANLGTSQLTFRGKDPPDGSRGRDPTTAGDDASGIHALDVIPADPPSSSWERDQRRMSKGGGGGHSSKMIQKSIDEKRRSRRRSSGKRNSEKLSSSAAATVATSATGMTGKDNLATASANANVNGKGGDDNDKSTKKETTDRSKTKKEKKKKEIRGILKKKSANPPPIAYFGGTFPSTANDVSLGMNAGAVTSSSSSGSEDDDARQCEHANEADNEPIVIHVGKINDGGEKKVKTSSRATTGKKQSNSHKSSSSKKPKSKSKQRQRHDDGNDGDDESVGVRSIGTKSGLRQGRFAAANAAAASKVDKNKFDSFSDDEKLDEDEMKLYGGGNGDVDDTFSEKEDENDDNDDDIVMEDDKSFRSDNHSLDRSSSSSGSKNGGNEKKHSSGINKLDEGASTLFDCTSSSYEDPVPITSPPDTETSPFDRTRSHFLRTADLGMTQDTIFAQQFLEHPTDIPEPHYHHPTPHPPPGVQFHIDENWISVDDGKGGHSPIAPQAVDALINMGYRVASDPMMWTPTVKTRKFMTEKRLRFDDIPIPGPLEEGEGGPGDVSCLLWSGKFSHKKYHGHELPVIRSQGIVNMCAEELVDLLMDSKRVNEYNPSSIGRNDDLILSDGKKEHCPFSGQRKKKLSGVVIDGARIVDGSAMMEDEQSEFTRESEYEEEIVFDDLGNRSVRSYNTDSSRREKKVSQFVGVTKLVRTTNRLPLIRKRLQFVTMLHCRALSDDQGGDGYIIVGRAVVPAEDAEKTQKVMRSEILLSVHIIRRLGGNKRSVGSSGNSVVSSSSGKKASKSDLANRCLMINVTHIKSPMIPNILAKKVGLSAAANFLADIRNLAK